MDTLSVKLRKAKGGGGARDLERVRARGGGKGEGEMNRGEGRVETLAQGLFEQITTLMQRLYNAITTATRTKTQRVDADSVHALRETEGCVPPTLRSRSMTSACQKTSGGA